MSLAGTKHVFEARDEPAENLDVELDPSEKEALERLTKTSPPNSGPVIAVDLDDVLSQTNLEVAACEYPRRSTYTDDI